MLVHTRAERELAVSHWLLSAADDIALARNEWANSGITLLRCGGVFTTIRLSARLVQAAVGTTDPDAIDAYLTDFLRGGPVIADTTSQLYYALVPASAASRSPLAARALPDVRILGPRCYLGVPHPQYTAPYERRSYWPVPMNGPGALGSPDAVMQLVTEARHRRTTTDSTVGP
ncbi:hypothetical protein [Streptomyces poonensis]|uniref:hypothetical protein n=1 Tax=Streptomyces poonensis TaxID=68255 RepID=UPI001E2A2900|nr:hypothetical protein [Streptomyces poonensis]